MNATQRPGSRESSLVRRGLDRLGVADEIDSVYGDWLHDTRPTATWEAETDWFRQYLATGGVEQLVERVVDANEDLQSSEEWARDRLTGTFG
jgi:hypothetical protein